MSNLSDYDVQRIVEELRRQDGFERANTVSSVNNIREFLRRAGLDFLVQFAGEIIKWLWKYVVG